MAGLWNTLSRMLPTRSSRLRRRAAAPNAGWSRHAASGALEQLESRRLLAITTVSGAWTGGVFDQVGQYENGVWQLDLDGDFVVGDDSPPFRFGIAGDLPVTGDWDGDGVHSVGVFRNGRFILDFNDNRTFDGGDIVRIFGRAGDTPVIGDWNGDGGDDLGIFRNARWALDGNGNLRWDGFDDGDTRTVFGRPTDRPVTGNWNPTSLRDGIGIYRDGRWGIDNNENLQFDPGTDAAFNFGVDSSQPFTGDFANDNTDEVGIVTADGTPFVRAVPQPQSAALASETLTTDVRGAQATASSNPETTSATVVEDDQNETNLAVADTRESREEEIEALFSRENFQTLEEITLSGPLA